MLKNYLLFFLILASFTVFSQNYSEKEIYSWYDLQMGIENSMLFRGIEYVETDRMINAKHKFLETQKFQNGVVTYGGQNFYEVPLKYNIYDDLLLVKLTQDKRNFTFQLISDRVDQFQIGDHKFKYIKANKNSDIFGFYEVINEKGAFKVLKKYIQIRKEIRDRTVAYSEFSAANPDYIFQFKNDFFELDNRRSLSTKFPHFKSELKTFYAKHGKQSRNNPDEFMNNLANKMNSLVLSARNEIEE